MSRNPSRGGHSSGIPITRMTAGDAEQHVKRVRTAAVLELPGIAAPQETGRILQVAKVGSFLPKEPVSWVITTDGTLYRLPEGLNAWAYDTIAVTLAAGGSTSGMFPCAIEFGRLEGRAYADFVT